MKISINGTKGLVVLHSFTLIIVLFAFAAFVKTSPEKLPYSSNGGSRIGVSGFTNRDHWTMETSILTCNGSFVFKDGELEDISSLSFSTPVRSLKSNHTLMDSLVYGTLSTNGANELTFVQTQQMVLPRMKMVNVIGNLTIGHKTQRIDLQLAYTVAKNKQLIFKGFKKIDLNEFGINSKNQWLKTVKFDHQVMIQIEMTLGIKPALKSEKNGQYVTGKVQI